MKTYLAILLLIVSAPVYSQVRMNKLSVNPIQLFGYNRLNMEYERGFKDGKNGISIYLGQTGNSTRKIHSQYPYLSEQNAALKFYAKSIDRSSFWYGGMISVTSGNIYSENGNDKALNIGALGILGVSGYQVVINSLYLNVYLGIGYALTNDLFGTAQYIGDFEKPGNWLLTYGFKIGFCFH